MRNAIKTDKIESGFKAFMWEGYCLEMDTLRRKLNPGYDPKDLSEEDQMLDWDNFERYYKCKYESA